MIKLSFIIIVRDDGRIVAVLENDVVPQSALRDIRTLMVEGGWVLHDAFRRNCLESYLDKLRSLVGTYYYRHKVDSYVAQGMRFDIHLYEPEVDVITHATFHERSDHGHLLKCNGQWSVALNNILS